MKLAHLWILHFLWLVPVLGVVLIVSARKRNRALAAFADAELLRRLTEPRHSRKAMFKGLLLLTALAFMLIALAGPQWGSHYQEVHRKGVDVVLVVDVSASMLVEDVKPSRLERARREIVDFLKVVEGDRVGLVAFSGAAFVQCPLTLDYAALEMFLKALRPELIPVPGTDLGAAIETGLSCFDFKSNTDKVIVLITDGEDNERKGRTAARKARDRGVRIFVFGIGDPSGAPIPATDGRGGFRKDAQGNLIVSKLDEEGLKEIAFESGGTYVRSVTADLDLDMLYFDGIKSVTKARTLKSGKIKVYEERFPLFLGAAVLLLLIEGLIEERKKSWGGLLFWPAVLLLLCSTPAWAAEHPDDLYRQGRFSEAEKAYARADMDRPRDVRFRYNRGCAAYRAGDYQAGRAAFSSVLRRTKDPRLRFRATYNLGNTAFKQGDFSAAADYYREALLARPGDQDAKYNLELALRALEKQKGAKDQKPGAGDKRGRNQDKTGQDGQQKDQSSQQDQQREKTPKKADRSPGTSSPGKEQSRPPENGQTKNPQPEQPKGSQPREPASPPGGPKKQEPAPTEPRAGLQVQPGAGAEGSVPEGQHDRNAAALLIDRKKAEALLNNVKEDRSKFLRFQVSGEKRQRGVASGKDW